MNYTDKNLFERFKGVLSIKKDGKVIYKKSTPSGTDFK